MTDARRPALPPDDGASEPTLPSEPETADPEEDGDDITDIPPRRHVPALTKLLLVAIVGTLAFAGGVLVQKQHDASRTNTSGVPDFATLFAGGAAGAGQIPGGALAGAGGNPAGSGGGSGTTGANGSAGDVPVLVGTVESIAGSELTVKDLGGTSHAVHATASTTLTLTGADWSGALTTGALVSVQGTKAADGSVTATAVIQR